MFFCFNEKNSKRVQAVGSGRLQWSNFCGNHSAALYGGDRFLVAFVASNFVDDSKCLRQEVMQKHATAQPHLQPSRPKYATSRHMDLDAAEAFVVDIK